MAVERARDFENWAGFGLRQRCREVDAAFPAVEVAALGQLSGLAEGLWQGEVFC